MRSLLSLLIFLFFAVSQPLYAINLDSNTNTEPPIHGEAAVLIDVQSGQTLYAKNPDESLPPASTTKIMTGLLAIENCDLNDMVTVSDTMLDNKQVYGTMIYLQPGEKLSLHDLLYATLLNSANDAAVAVAEKAGGSVAQFVDMMNARAKSIGATNTHFENPSGLHNPQHLTTAHDLALIALTAYKNPVFSQIVNTKTQVIQRNQLNVPTEMINENKLLWRDSSVTGIKTGYTTEAGNCLVASAVRGDRQLIAVILKAPSGMIFSDMSALLDYGFNHFETNIVYSAGDSMGSLQIDHNPVNMILSSPVYETVNKVNPQSDINLKIVNEAQQLYNIEKGQTIAQLEVWDHQQKLQVIPLQASATVQSFSNKFFAFAQHYLIWICLGLLMFVPIILHSIYLQKQKKRRLERMNRKEALREKYYT